MTIGYEMRSLTSDPVGSGRRCFERCRQCSYRSRWARKPLRRRESRGMEPRVLAMATQLGATKPMHLRLKRSHFETWQGAIGGQEATPHPATGRAVHLS